MPDDWQNHDFNGGEWWQQIPPPPGSDDNYYETFDDDLDRLPDYNIPVEPNFPTPDNMYPGQLTGDQSAAWDYLVDINTINPAQIRGIAFSDYYEAIEWLAEIGLLGFSKVIFSGGFYYPVIGDSDGGEAADEQTDATDWDFEGGSY